MLTPELLEVLLEQCPHTDDAVRHPFDLTQPLFIEAWVVENLRSNPSTVNGRIGIQWAHQDLDLGVYSLLLFR